MNESTARWLGIGGETGLAARCVSILAWMLVALAPVSWVGYLLYGQIGVVAAAAAALCCLAGAIPPVVLAQYLRGPQHALLHVVVGMFSRMTIPLALGIVVQYRRGPLSAAGFLLDLVVFFCVGLLFDTLSLLSAAQSASPPGSQATTNPS